MKLPLQDEILKNYPMSGIDSSLPSEPIQPGLTVPDWVNEGPLYEIFIRNFTNKASFAGAEKKLPYLKNLGVKTIWLMPIHPIGKEKRKGKLGSPYAIRDHVAINPDYGSVQEFKHLVAAVHDYDMRIIIDMVLNHGAWDHIKNNSNPDMFNTKFVRSPQDWSDVREFNFDSPHTNTYALDVLTYWLQEYGIDGYRCDVAGLVPLELWENAVERLLNIKPDLYMLAEWQNRALLNKSFHSTYDWTSYLLMKEVYRGKRSARDLLIWEQQLLNGYPVNTQPLKFTENHDMPRTITTFGKNRFFPFAAFTFFVKGIPLIYNGQEIGFDKEPSLFEKSTMDWNLKNERVYEFYKKLIHIRYTNKSVFNGNLHNILNNQPENVVSFIRGDEKKNLIIILNFSDDNISVNVKFPAFIKVKALINLINDNQVKFNNNNIKLSAKEILVLKVRN